VTGYYTTLSLRLLVCLRPLSHNRRQYPGAWLGCHCCLEQSRCLQHREVLPCASLSAGGAQSSTSPWTLFASPADGPWRPRARATRPRVTVTPATRTHGRASGSESVLMRACRRKVPPLPTGSGFSRMLIMGRPFCGCRPLACQPISDCRGRVSAARRGGLGSESFVSPAATGPGPRRRRRGPGVTVGGPH
jgi:hypothetical protein